MGNNSEMNEGLFFLGAYGTLEVLEYMKTHPQCRERDLEGLVKDTTVQKLVRKLQETKMITDELALTEKGEIVLEQLVILTYLLQTD